MLILFQGPCSSAIGRPSSCHYRQQKSALPIELQRRWVAGLPGELM